MDHFGSKQDQLPLYLELLRSRAIMASSMELSSTARTWSSRSASPPLYLATILDDDKDDDIANGEFVILPSYTISVFSKEK